VEYDLSKKNGKSVKKEIERCGECRVKIYEKVQQNKN
jgi:hypothetical protein